MAGFPQGHALLIGVDTYQHHTELNVPQTAADARLVGDVLKQACGYPAAQITVLHGSGATRAATLAALDTLAQTTRPDDMVLLLYSGHGAFGTDGTTYYLTTHDTRLHTMQDSARHRRMAVRAETAVSHTELLTRLRAIAASRLLVCFNSCFAGTLSPTQVLSDSDLLHAGQMLPEQTAYAMLGTGEGRAIITAARERQYAFVGTGKRTIFGQALVDGLRGYDLPNREGVITLFDLYAYIYNVVGEETRPLMPMVPEVMRRRHGSDRQQPELTLLKQTGVMTMALHPGTVPPTPLSAGVYPGAGLPVREVEYTTAQIALRHLMQPHVQMASGTRVVGGNVAPVDTTGTTGTTSLQGDSTAGDRVQGDKVGRDKTTIGGDQVQGDKNVTHGSQTSIRDNQGQVAIGSGIAQASGGSHATVSTTSHAIHLPRLSDTRLVQVVQATIQHAGLDALLFALRGYLSHQIEIDQAALSSNEMTEAFMLVDLCRVQRQRAALIESLLDLDALGTPQEQEAWVNWARAMDGQ